VNDKDDNNKVEDKENGENERLGDKGDDNNDDG
jgi:hypothetical protein